MPFACNVANPGFVQVHRAGRFLLNNEFGLIGQLAIEINCELICSLRITFDDLIFLLKNGRFVSAFNLGLLHMRFAVVCCFCSKILDAGWVVRAFIPSARFRQL